jgi:ribosome maturation factor RimP
MPVELFPLLEPVVSEAGVELVDAEYRSGVVLVTIDGPDGIDLDLLARVHRVVSDLLDERDPIPGSYTLEVSSPGVERTLRRPAHFTRAVGETVSVKTRPQVPGDRRLTGRLVAADEQGLDLEVEGATDGPVRLAYSDIDRCRTVFAWGPAPKPGAAAKTKTKTKQTTTQKRKQVTTS